MVAMYVGDPEKGAKVIQPLKDLGPVVELIQPMPYTVFQAILDPMAPKGHRSYWRGEYLKGFSDGAIATFVRHATGLAAAAQPHQVARRRSPDRPASLHFRPNTSRLVSVLENERR
jgi:hypothetical protein